MQNLVKIYTGPSGEPKTSTSYSSRKEFKRCKKAFYYSRQQGYKERQVRAAMWFGKCVEAGWQYYEEHSRTPGSGQQKFLELWEGVAKLKGASDFVYTKNEGDWASLWRAGQEMLRLYELRVARFPIPTHPAPRFQVPLRKKIFPGSHLDILTNTAYLDMVALPVWNHPMLPPIPTPENLGDGVMLRPLVIDCKVMGDDLDELFVGLDGQLIDYAWESRYPDVAMLWFTKRTHGIKKSSRVTLLQDLPVDEGKRARFAGDELYVIDNDAKTSVVHLGPYRVLDELDNALENVKGGKATDIATAAFLEKHEEISPCFPSEFTKQRLQLKAARISEERINEYGRVIARDTVEMVRAAEDNFYPMEPSFRFPDEKCPLCAFRGLCLDDAALRDKLLVRDGEEWLEGKDTDA